MLPDMAITCRRRLEPGDALLVCSDGLWGPLKDEEIGAALYASGSPIREKLMTLARRAVKRAGPGSDNTSAAALQWLGETE